MNPIRYKRRRGLFILLALPAAALFISLFTWIVMLLWNNVLAQVVHVGQVTFFQAMGILVLSKILFGGFGMRGRGRNWRSRMREKYDRMSPEEKEKFREKMNRCGRWTGNEEIPGALAE